MKAMFILFSICAAAIALCIVIALINCDDSDDYMQALEDEEQARYLAEWTKKRRAKHGHK